jgi:hypothetical protein
LRPPVNNGKHVLAASISGFDPSATSSPKFAATQRLECY